MTNEERMQITEWARAVRALANAWQTVDSLWSGPVKVPLGSWSYPWPDSFDEYTVEVEEWAKACERDAKAVTESRSLLARVVLYHVDEWGGLVEEGSATAGSVRVTGDNAHTAARDIAAMIIEGGSGPFPK